MGRYERSPKKASIRSSIFLSFSMLRPLARSLLWIRARIAARRLPVSFRRIHEAVLVTLESVRPHAVVCFGLTPARTVSIERLAINVAHVNPPTHFPTTADNEGLRPSCEPLNSKGEDVYWSTLPIPAIVKAVGRTLKPMRTRIIPLISHHAGTHMCNATFYLVAEWARRTRSPIPAGFIHVPPLRDGREESSAQKLARWSPFQLQKVSLSAIKAVARACSE